MRGEEANSEQDDPKQGGDEGTCAQRDAHGKQRTGQQQRVGMAYLSDEPTRAGRGPRAREIEEEH